MQHKLAVAQSCRGHQLLAVCMQPWRHLNARNRMLIAPHPLITLYHDLCLAMLMHSLFRYLPIAGYKPFVDSAVKLALGDDNPAIRDGRVAAIQSLSGTGACRVMAEFMHRYMPGGHRSHALGASLAGN